MAIDRESRFDDTEERMRELISGADLPAPDEIVRDRENAELVLFWHEQRLVVTIELDDPLTSCGTDLII
jgi:hypothetical protein